MAEIILIGLSSEGLAVRSVIFSGIGLKCGSGERLTRDYQCDPKCAVLLHTALIVMLVRVGYI